MPLLAGAVCVRVYPRTGGGNGYGGADLWATGGLSPHGRGKPRWLNLNARLARSIPARAGETDALPFQPSLPEVYPRTGGGNQGRKYIPAPWRGLSPHGRGKRSGLRRKAAAVRSIPARAGETLCWNWGGGRLAAVYPRTGGGNPAPILDLLIRWGLSPHGRGKPRTIPASPPASRSIPARAGETSDNTGITSRIPVYPRTGGGNALPATSAGDGLGLSPHGRGKHHSSHLRLCREGSIPARAGETFPLHLGGVQLQVYPRTGGGNRCSAGKSPLITGLSPHGRGKHHIPFPCIVSYRSIPARAGETEDPCGLS